MGISCMPTGRLAGCVFLCVARGALDRQGTYRIVRRTCKRENRTFTRCLAGYLFPCLACCVLERQGIYRRSQERWYRNKPYAICLLGPLRTEKHLWCITSAAIAVAIVIGITRCM